MTDHTTTLETATASIREAVTIRPGDQLVVAIDSPVSEVDSRQIRAYLTEKLNCEVFLVAGEGVSLARIRTTTEE